MTLRLASEGVISSRRAEVWAAAARHGCYGLIPAGVTIYIWWLAAAHHSLGADFHHAFWPAGRDVLNGITPYVGTNSPLVNNGVAFVYPAPAALLFAAFAWMPHAAADVLATTLCISAVPAALWILGVRDWRLYGLVLLWPPVISGWQTANLTLLLVLAIAVAWRLRNRALISGVIVGVAVSLKVFVWPLGLWLLATRRYAALGWAVATALAANLFAWAILGFQQIHAYTALVGAVTKVEERTAYTPIAVALHLGASLNMARAVTLILAALLAAYCTALGRRGRERSSLLLAIAVSLLATPIVWLHYFALLLVPVAIARPRLSGVWLIPLLTFPCPVTTPAVWQLVVALGSMSLVVAALMYRPRQVVTDRVVSSRIRARVDSASTASERNTWIACAARTPTPP